MCARARPRQEVSAPRNRREQGRASPRPVLFFGTCGGLVYEGLHSPGAGATLNPDADPEPQRARPPRCEAAPPTKKGPRTRQSGFLKRPGTASFFVLRLFGSIGPSPPAPSPRSGLHPTPLRPRAAGVRGYNEPASIPGTTGFDVVGSRGWGRGAV